MKCKWLFQSDMCSDPNRPPQCDYMDPAKCPGFEEPELPGDDGLLSFQEDYWIFIVWTALMVGMAATSAAAIRLSVRRQSWGQPQAPCVTKPKPDCGMTLREWASAPAEVPACQK